MPPVGFEPTISAGERPAATHLLRSDIQSHIILHQLVSLNPVTIVRVPYNKNTINIQIIVKTCTIKPLDDTFNFL